MNINQPSIEVKFYLGMTGGIGGSAITIIELVTKSASLIVALGGGALALAGGYYAFRVKKMEARLKEAELRAKGIDPKDV
jgi:hypothetical protein